MPSRPAMDIFITGNKSLDRAFKEMPKRLRDKILKSVTKPIAKKAEAKMAVITPVYTGRMKSSYYTRVASLKLSDLTKKRKTRKNVVGHVVRFGKRDKLGIPPGEKYYYPAIIEYGSEARNIRPRVIMRGVLKRAPAWAFPMFKNRMKVAVILAINEARRRSQSTGGIR